MQGDPVPIHYFSFDTPKKCDSTVRMNIPLADKLILATMAAIGAGFGGWAGWEFRGEVENARNIHEACRKAGGLPDTFKIKDENGKENGVRVFACYKKHSL
jgi:predicted dienelactone hydrolase